MRGGRSQNYVNRKLGYKFNQVYRWESGYTSIAWSDFLKFASVCRVDTKSALSETLLFKGSQQKSEDLITHLIGDAKVSSVSTLLSKSRFTVGRWLRAESEPMLEDILALIHFQGLALAEFIEKLVPLDSITEIEPQLLSRKRQKQLFCEEPRVAAVLVCFTLSSYLQLPRHEVGFVANKLNLDLDTEKILIQKLVEVGLIHNVDGKFKVADARINTRSNFEDWLGLRKFWTKQALEYLENLKAQPNDVTTFGYHVFAISPKATKELQKALVDFYSNAKAIIGNDKDTAEEIFLLNLQLFKPTFK